jgi:flagellar hook assembly protein FlgD
MALKILQLSITILTQATAQVRIKIFDSKGRLVRTLLNNQASGQNGSVIFDGLDDENKALRIGIYIIFLEALNDNSGVVETIKNSCCCCKKTLSGVHLKDGPHFSL